MSSRRSVVFSVVLSFVSGSVSSLGAQATSAPTDSSTEARVDRIFATWDRTDSPGCALGVFRDGRIAYARGYGMANLELGVAITPRSVFDIGSTSKQFTAMSVMLLAQQGKLSLDDDVRRFLPEMPDYGKRITIRHILTHTSGLRDYLTLWALAGVDDADLTTDQDAYALLTRQRELNFAPGEQWLYSNSGFFLASMIVQRASGKTLARFADEQIFRVLGMRHTRFNDDHMAVIPDRATGYEPRRGPDARGFATSMSNFEQTGDGAIQTSIEDLLLWDENFYSGKVGGAATLATMQTPAVLNDGRKQTYALGLTVSTHRGLRTVSHGGSWAGYRAELLRFPDQHLSVACLCNLASTNPSALARQVAEVYLGSLMQPAEATVATAGRSAPPQASWQPRVDELGAFAGEYFSPELETTYRLAVRDGKLLVHRRRGEPVTLEPDTVDGFRFGGTRLRFSRERGRVTGFLVDAGRTRNLRFARR